MFQVSEKSMYPQHFISAKISHPVVFPGTFDKQNILFPIGFNLIDTNCQAAVYDKYVCKL